MRGSADLGGPAAPEVWEAIMPVAQTRPVGSFKRKGAAGSGIYLCRSMRWLPMPYYLRAKALAGFGGLTSASPKALIACCAVR